MTIQLSELVDALEMQGDGVEQYLDLETHRIILITEDLEAFGEEESADDARPDWARELIADARAVREHPDRFLELPARQDLREGRVVRDFIDALASDDHRRALEDAFRGKGAFRRFKNAADELALLEQWYAFRRDAFVRFAVEWCEDNEIPFEMDVDRPSAGAKPGNRVVLDPRTISPDTFLAAAQQVRQTFYWEKKDLATYVVVATHLLDTALVNAKGTSKAAQFFSARSLGLSFDIASLTWTGWNEPGIAVTPALQAVGLEAARLNLELAQQQKAPKSVRDAAHFILGAQLLAAGDAPQAIRVWSSAPDARSTRVWVLLAKVVQGEDPSELDATLHGLLAQGGESGEIANQVQTARSVFVRR